MGLSWTRREAVCASLLAVVSPLWSRVDPHFFNEVFEAVWQSVRDQFYDPNTRGVDWLRVKEEFASRVPQCQSSEELLRLLREMLNRLHNSHIFLYSREEWERRQNVLPFLFDKAKNKVFVRDVLLRRDESQSASLRLGDEVLAIDNTGAINLQPITLVRLQDVMQNPYFGPKDSSANIRIQRAGRVFAVQVRRGSRPGGFEPAVLKRSRGGIAILRLLTLESSQLPESRLGEIWNGIQSTKGLVVDLRNCVGGDSKAISFIVGSLTGERRKLFTEVPRAGGQDTPVTEYSNAEASRYRGKVALLINANTESAPEALAAICKEYGCATLLGERTGGALNGWTKAIPLPNGFARFALPYTRGVSPKGVDYEGVGVAPDVLISNSPSDYRQGRDRVLGRAIKEVSR